MASPENPFTVTYSKPGVKPPVYLAGTFSNPPWLPQQMQSTRTADDEYLFSLEVQVVAGREYEIKFRIGEGNWWVYDEDKPVVTNGDGNENNIITMPLPHKSVTDRRQSAGKVLNELGLRDHGSAPSTKVVSDKGSSLDQIADKHQAMLNDTSHVSDEATEFEYTWQKKEPNPLVTPLFAHECFGAYEFIADDRMDHEDVPELVHRRQSKKSPKDYTVDQIDLNDPNIEMFPSDKSSVLNSLHKIQSSLSAKRSSVDDAPVLSSIEFRRSSVDSGDDSAASTGSMSPTTPTSHKTRENRHSYSGFKKTKSAVSLTSIAEEPKVGDRASPTLSSSSLLKPGESHSPLSSRSPSSEGEDVLVMNGYQEKHKNIRTGRANLSCDPMDERRLDTLQVLQPSHEIA